MADGIKVHIYGDYDNKDIDRAIRDLQSLKTQAPVTGSAIGGLNKAMLGLGVAAAGAVSLGMVSGYMKDAWQAGSDLAESQSKVGVVFGQSAAEVRKWSETSAEAMGVSQRAALEAAGTYGNLFQAFGVGQKQAQEMSTSLVQMASDLASFNNTGVDEAIQALRSGLSGETEPLKRYGIALTDARLKQEALAMGIYKGVGMLSAGQKAQAAYNLVFKDGKLAIGDYERTADGAANTVKTLEAQLEDAKATIGTALVDAVMDATEALGGAGGFSSGIESASENVATFIAGLGAAVAKTIEFKNATSDIAPDWLETGVGWVGNLTQAIDPVHSVIDGIMTMGQEEQNAKKSSKELSDQLAAAATIRKAYAGDLNDIGSQTRDLAYDTEQAKEQMEAFKDAAEALTKAISASQTYDDFREKLRGISKELAGNVASFDGWGKGAKENRDTIRDLFSDAEATVQAWVDSGKIAATDFGKAMEPLAERIIKKFREGGMTRKEVMDFLGKENIWTGPAEQQAKAAVNAARKTARDLAPSIGADLASGIAVGLSSNQSKVNQMARELIQEATAAAKAEGGIKSPSTLWEEEVGKNLSKGAAKGISSASSLEEIRKAARELVKAANQEAIDAAQQYQSMVASAWSEVVDGQSSALDAIKSFQDAAASVFMGGIDLGAAWKGQWDSAGAETGISLVQGFQSQVDAKKLFESVIRDLKSQNASDALIAEVMSKGEAVGAALGKGILDQNLVGYFSDSLQDLTNSAMDAAQFITPTGLLWGAQAAAATAQGFVQEFGEQGPSKTALLTLMSGSFADIGKQSTKEMLKAAKQVIANSSESFRAWASENLSIEIPVNLRVSGSGGIDGARANGGGVKAGGTYLVGEEGPELLHMGGSSGYVSPNSALTGASTTNVYTIKVDAGFSNPRETAQSVVEAIVNFENSSGPVWVRAS